MRGATGTLTAAEAEAEQTMARPALTKTWSLMMKTRAATMIRRRFAKLADFGLAVVKSESSTLATVSSAGTTNWKAPELSFKTGRATHASDMYSFACVLYELASGQAPWAGEDR